MTDVLHSTSSTRVLHDGADVTRLQKVSYVGGSDLALRHLHVCFRQTAELNCGQCRKCTLAMLGLLLSGAGRCATFPPGGPDLARVRRLLFTRGQRLGVRRLRELALRQGRPDVVRALDCAVRRSALLRAVLLVLDRGARIRRVSMTAGRLRRALLARVVR
jgi:hypothetical protein